MSNENRTGGFKMISYMEWECRMCKKIFPKRSRANRRLFCDTCKVVRHSEQSIIHSKRLQREKEEALKPNRRGNATNFE